MTAALITTAAPRQTAPRRAMLQRRCACGKAAAPLGNRCEECARRQLYGASPVSARANHPPPDPGPGRPLDGDTRRFFEGRFGHDLGSVRIHDGDHAAAAAQALDAHAFTTGDDIVFARGRFDPGSNSGQRLLAHELTHVLQQRRAPVGALLGGTGAPAELEAERNAALLHGTAPLNATQHAPALARQASGTSITVDALAGPPGCTLDQHHVIEPAVNAAQERLRRAQDRLDAYVAAPAEAANQPVAAALQRHFHRSDPAVARTVRERVARIRNDMVSRTPFTVECHDASDSSCTNSNAYVQNENMLVFCPSFFTEDAARRPQSLTHEMAHALTGLDIDDRAYRNDRLLPHLSTAEALDNAESYSMFVSELATGTPVVGNPPRDEVEDCTERTAPLVHEAIARAQRWNRDAEVVAHDQRPGFQAQTAPFFTAHLGDALPATRTAAARIFSRMVTRLRSSLDVRCDDSPAAACSATRHAYKGSASNAGRYALTGMGIGAGIGGAGGLGAAIGMWAGGAGFLPGLGALALGGLIGMALGAIVGAIAGALSPRDQIRLCPSWAALPGMPERAEALLAAVYETHAGLDAAQAARHAAFARAVHERWWPAPPGI